MKAYDDHLMSFTNTFQEGHQMFVYLHVMLVSLIASLDVRFIQLEQQPLKLALHNSHDIRDDKYLLSHVCHRKSYSVLTKMTQSEINMTNFD